MSQNCCYCHTEVVPVNIGDASFRICPRCHATFLSSKMMGAVRRNVDRSSRQKWSEALSKSAANFAAPAIAPCCMEHGTTLVEGMLPDVSIPGLVAPCCTLLHLTPQQMHTLLARSLEGPDVHMNDLTRSKKPDGFLRRLITKFDKGDAPIDDGLSGALWEMKIRPALERTC